MGACFNQRSAIQSNFPNVQGNMPKAQGNMPNAQGNMPKDQVSKIIRSNTQFDVAQTGEIFYIKHKELEKIQGNVIGGKERVELILSLKPQHLNPSDLTFKVSISSTIHKDVFNSLGNAGIINLETMIYPTTFIVDYVFECLQHVHINVKYKGSVVDTVKTNISRIFGSKGHCVEFPIFINENEEILVANIHAVAPQVEARNIVFVVTTQFEQDTFGDFSVIISNSNYQGKEQKVYKPGK
jgi:hypothetical protein